MTVAASFAVAARPALVAKAVARGPGISLDQSQSVLAAKLARHYDGELCRNHLLTFGVDLWDLSSRRTWSRLTTPSESI